MSKDKEKKPEVQEPAKAPPPESGLPRWAVAVGLVMIVAGCALFAAREPMRRSAAVQAFNQANVSVNTISDGLADGFATTVIDTNRSEFLEVLGACRTEPKLARHVFDAVMDKGTVSGRVLCCKMAFFMAQDGQEDAAGMNSLMQSVAGQLAADREAILRAQAQWVMGYLVAIKDPSKAKAFSELPKQPESSKGSWLARTKEETFGDGPNAVTVATIRWSTPDACLAWWQTFGSKGVWDPKLKRFLFD